MFVLDIIAASAPNRYVASCCIGKIEATLEEEFTNPVNITNFVLGYSFATFIAGFPHSKP